MPSNSSPYSYVRYVSSGTGPFAINFDYLTSSHLSVSVNGSTLASTAYTVDTNANTVTLSSPAAANSVIIIQRSTPKGKSGFQTDVADFSDGSVLKAEDLDQAALGLLYVAQEADDSGSANSLSKDLQDNKFDALNANIKNVATPTTEDHAVTKQYVDGLSLYNSPTPLSVYTFTGDTTTTDFVMDPAPASTDPKAFIVDVGGVAQRPTTDYTISGTTLTFGTAPPTATITVRNIGVARDTLAQPLVADGSAATLTLKEKSGQTSANLVEFKSAADVVIASVSKTGSAGFVDLSASGDVAVAGTTALAGDVNAASNATVGGTLTASGIMNVVGALQFNGQAGIKIHSIGQFELISDTTFAYNNSQVDDDSAYMVSGLKYEVTPHSANSKFLIIGDALVGAVGTVNGTKAGGRAAISLNNTAAKGSSHNGTIIGSNPFFQSYIAGGDFITSPLPVTKLYTPGSAASFRLDIVHRNYLAGGGSVNTGQSTVYLSHRPIFIVEFSS